MGIRIQYVPKKFSASSQALIDLSNQIITTYRAAGYSLTLRQLYYQHVAAGNIANKQTEYKRLGSIVNDARLAGLMDWDAIEDRTRNLESVSHWSSPASIIDSAAYSFRFDKWEDQPFRPEVWVEKEALAGVVEAAAVPLDIAYFSCRGYVSQSEAWGAAVRLQRYTDRGQKPFIIHLGDHDPSGIDMSRDIRERQRLFGVNLYEADPEDGFDPANLPRRYDGVFHRIALNMDQIQQYGPPPNPAKQTDSRFEGYLAEYGDESWELDALNPTTLRGLIDQAVLSVRDDSLWDKAVKREEEAREALRLASENWDDVANYVEAEFGDRLNNLDEEED